MTVKPEDYMFEYRIIMVGDSTAGKTSLAERFVRNNYFDNRLPTIGLNKYKKIVKIGQYNYNIEIIDTMGQERYVSLGVQFFRNCDGVILVYDVSNKNSYNNIENWLKRVNDNNANKLPITIFENKIDKPENEWAVTREENKSLSEKLVTKIFSVSALNGEGVENAFIDIIGKVVESNKDNENNKRIKLKKQYDKEHRKLC